MHVVKRHPITPWLMVAAAGLMVVGILGGLQRLGWPLGLPLAGPVVFHGPVMVVGFFGALISLERAVAMGRTWMYLVPLLHAVAGWVWAFQGLPPAGLRGLTLIAALSYLALAPPMLRLSRALYTQVMVAGIGAWAVAGLLLALNQPMHRVALWWIAYFVFTIAGERLELGRLTGAAQRFGKWLATIMAVYVAGLVLVLFTPWGYPVMALGLMGTALWLLRFDVAWVSIRHPGLSRFIGSCLLTGYVWLLVAGVILSTPLRGWLYDAALHSVMLGFVFAMVFGHAPIIFPALLGLPLRFHPVLYAPLALLHLSVLLRVAGDVAQQAPWRLWGGMGSGLAILLYALSMVTLRLLERRGTHSKVARDVTG